MPTEPPRNPDDSRMRVDESGGAKDALPWTPERSVLDLWAEVRLDELEALGKTARYNRFAYATEDEGRVFHDVLQPSLHTYPGARFVADLQRTVQKILGDELSKQVIWLRPDLVHLNLARHAPKSREQEHAINRYEGDPARRQQVQNGFLAYEKDGETVPFEPIEMKVNGVTANDSQLMVTFSVDSWEAWQQLAVAAKAMGLTSFALEKDPVNKGFLVSMTLGIWGRTPDDQGYPTGPIVEKLRPYRPGGMEPVVPGGEPRDRFVEEFGEKSFIVKELAWVLHHHQQGFPIMSPGFYLARPRIGTVQELDISEDVVVPDTVEGLLEELGPNRTVNIGLELV